MIPSVLPTGKPTIRQPTISPTGKPTIRQPTIRQPTISPTFQNKMSFETSMTLSGLTKPELDKSSQTAIVIAVSKSSNISSEYVSFENQHLIIQRKLTIYHILSTYSVEAITKISMPISNINPLTLYTMITKQLSTSVANGNFIIYLTQISILLNTTTQNVVVSNFVNSPMIVIMPTEMPTEMPTKMPTNPNNIFIVIFTIVGIFVIIQTISTIVNKKYTNNILKNKFQPKKLIISTTISNRDFLLPNSDTIQANFV
jgi:hypothetical protein